MTGYTDCACRDCFEIAIAGADNERALCNACGDAGCSPDDGECEAPHAYCDGGEAEGDRTTCGAPF
jgi:hypothetical protein